MLAPDPHSRCGTSPREGGRAALCARGAAACARGGRRPRDQATRRDPILPPWEAVQVMHGIAPPAVEPRAETGHGVHQLPGGGLLGGGGLADGTLQSGPPLGIVGEQRQVARKTFVPSGRGTALGAPRTVRLRGALLADLRPGVLAGGGVDRRAAFRALAPQRGPASEEGAGRAQLRRRARGLRAPATTEPDRHRVRSARSVCGGAAVEGVQRAGLPQAPGQARWRTQVGQPRPGQETRDGHNAPRAVRGESLAQGCWSGWHSAVHQAGAIGTQEADVQASGGPSDATVQWVLVGGASVP
jgi:hypothetical protein